MSVKRITASGNDTLIRGQRILGARLISGSADALASLFDEAGGATSGKEFCDLAVTEDTANGTGASHPAADVQMFGDKGFYLQRGLSLTLSGTGAVLYVYYE